GGKEIRLGGSFPYPGASVSQTMQPDEYKRQQLANERWSLLNNALNNAIQSLLVDANPKMQVGDQLLINVGGGLKVPTMTEQLTARLKALKPEENYLLVPDSVTTALNAIGLYAYVYWQLLLIQQRLSQYVSTQNPIK